MCNAGAERQTARLQRTNKEQQQDISDLTAELQQARSQLASAQQALDTEWSDAQQQHEAGRVELAATKKALLAAQHEESQIRTNWKAAERKLEAEKDELQVRS